MKIWGMEREHPRRGIDKRKCDSQVDQSSHLKTEQFSMELGKAAAMLYLEAGSEDWASGTSSSELWTGHAWQGFEVPNNMSEEGKISTEQKSGCSLLFTSHSRKSQLQTLTRELQQIRPSDWQGTNTVLRRYCQELTARPEQVTKGWKVLCHFGHWTVT